MDFFVLGNVAASGTEGDVDLGGLVVRMLLGALVLRANQPISADRLAEDIWPQGPPPSAATTLKAHVSRLRRALGQAEPGAEARIIGARGTYELRVDVAALDAATFEVLAVAGHDALEAGDPATARDKLVGALALWRGEVPYAEIADTEAARPEINRLQELRRRAEEDLVDAQLELGEHETVTPTIDRMTREEPTRERRVGQLMRALYASGRQVEALRAYDRFRRTLNEELGLEPGPQLRQLEQSILLHEPELLVANQPSRAAPPSPTPTTQRARSGVWPPSPPAQVVRMLRGSFVGRDQEIADLRDFAKAIANGDRLLFAISGDPGMGKSRLVAEFLSSPGQLVLGLYTQADTELLMPYHPVVQALDALVGLLPDDTLAELDAVATSSLTALLPEVARRRPASIVTGVGERETERYRLFEAIRRLLELAGDDMPTLLVVDDAHAIDRETIRLLRYLLRHGSTAGFGVVLAYREVDLERDAPLRGLIDDVDRDQQLRRATLSGLESEAAAWLIRRDATVDLSEFELAEIASSSGGNPLFIGEILHQVNDGLPADSVPPRLSAMIEQRMQRLSSSCRDVLDVSATIGREFALDVVVRSSGFDEGVVLDAIEEALRAKVLAELPDGVGRYTFIHALFNEVRYDALTSTARARLHRAVLEALDGRDVSAAEMARHSTRAVPLVAAEVAVAWCRQAGGEALALASFDEAATHFERGLTLAAEYRMDASLRGELLVSLATARSASVEVDPEADEAFRAAAVAAREAGRADLLAEVALGLRARFAGGLYGFSGVGTTDDELAELIEEALDQLEPNQRVLRSLLLSRLAQTRYWDTPVEQRRAWTNEALVLAEAEQDPRARGVALVGRRYATWVPGGAADRLADARLLVELGRQAGAPDIQIEGLRWLIFDLLEIGDIDEAAATIELHQRLATELRRPVYRGYAELSVGLLALLRGNFSEGRSIGDRTLSLLHEAGMRLANSLYSSQVMLHHWDTGALHNLADDVGAIALEITDLAAVECGLAFVAAETGDLDGAHALLDRLAPDEFATIGDDVSAAAGLAMLAVVAHRTNAGHHAAVLLRRLLPLAGTNVVIGPPAAAFFGPADFFLGLLYDCQNDLDAAEISFEAAMRMADAMGARPMQARTRLRLAGVLSRGNPRQRRRSIALREHAVDLARSLGMNAIGG